MNFNIPSAERNLEELRANCHKYRQKARFWRLLLYLSLFAVTILAFLALIARMATGSHEIPNVLAHCMLPAIILFLISFSRWKHSASQADSWSLLIRPIEERLIAERNDQDII